MERRCEGLNGWSVDASCCFFRQVIGIDRNLLPQEIPEPLEIWKSLGESLTLEFQRLGETGALGKLMGPGQ